MNFETAFEKYKNGTATEEEKAFVESEIAKARKLNEIIDEMDSRRVVEPARTEEVKAVITKMKKKSGIRIAVISVAVVLILAIISAVSLFIYVNVGASGKAEYTKAECIELAKQGVAERDKSGEDIRVSETERELVFKYGRLSSAKYIYELEIRCGYTEYDVTVDSVTGEVVIERD